jgi:hypothetical protein
MPVNDRVAPDAGGQPPVGDGAGDLEAPGEAPPESRVAEPGGRGATRSAMKRSSTISIVVTRLFGLRKHPHVR